MARKQPTADAFLADLDAKGIAYTVTGARKEATDYHEPQRRGRPAKLVPDASLAERISKRPPTGCEICVTVKAKTRGPNSREHYHARAKRVADEQLELSLLLNAHAMKREHLVGGCVVTMCRVGHRVDDDNLRGYLKGLRDMTAQFLLGGRMGEMDSDPRIEWRYDQRYLGPRAAGVIVSIVPRTEAASDATTH
jgi:hypothetical protein